MQIANWKVRIYIIKKEKEKGTANQYSLQKNIENDHLKLYFINCF